VLDGYSATVYCGDGLIIINERLVVRNTYRLLPVIYINKGEEMQE
jgi:hypothetical protein